MCPYTTWPSCIEETFRIFLCLFAGVAGPLPEGKTGDEDDDDDPEHASNVGRKHDRRRGAGVL